MKRQSNEFYKLKYVEAEELWKTGKYTLIQLEKIIGIGYAILSKELKKRGYKINAHGKKNLNSNIFNIIDTEEKAYWLGFLYADGCVTKNKKGHYMFELGLRILDKPHVEKFKNFVSSEHTIKYREKTKSCRIMFGDTNFCEDLTKLGCVPRKSLILKFPTEEQVPSDLIHHFIRGYFDGDGYISKRVKGMSMTVNILGTYEFLKGLCETNKLNFGNLLKKDIRHKNNTFFINMTGQNARNFCQYIYKDATIYLERKYENYKSHPEEFYRDTVYQYDLEGNFIQEHYNGSTAAKQTNLSHSSISKSCYTGVQIGGFLFKFKNR